MKTLAERLEEVTVLSKVAALAAYCAVWVVLFRNAANLL